MRKKIINGVQYSIAAIIFHEDKVLMFERQGESWETGWEFIKGAMHHGETEKQAVLREIKEESGIKVRILGKLPKPYWDEKPYRGGKLKIHARIYTCQYVSGNIRLGEREHRNWKWMSLEEAINCVWIKNGGEMIRKSYKIYICQKTMNLIV